jgi:hypothetical protein
MNQNFGIRVPKDAGFEIKGNYIFGTESESEEGRTGKLTEAEVNAREAVKWEHDHAAAFFAVDTFKECKSGPCDQGRKLCHTPEACQRALEDFCGYTWADRFSNWFWSLPIIENAGPGTGAAIIAIGIVSLIAVAAVCL